MPILGELIVRDLNAGAIPLQSIAQHKDTKTIVDFDSLTFVADHSMDVVFLNYIGDRRGGRGLADADAMGTARDFIIINKISHKGAHGTRGGAAEANTITAAVGYGIVPNIIQISVCIAAKQDALGAAVENFIITDYSGSGSATYQDTGNTRR